MNMPTPPSEPLSAKDRVRLWILRHKIASAVIALVALFTLVGAIANAGSGPEASNGPTTTPPTSAAVSAPTAPEEARVPRVLGINGQLARQRLRHAGFEVTVKTRYSHENPGTVLRVSAESGTSLPVGAAVSITVAKAFPTVPNVVGLSQAKAAARLRAADYVVRVSKQESSQAAGTVISMSPRREASGCQAQASQSSWRSPSHRRHRLPPLRPVRPVAAPASCITVAPTTTALAGAETGPITRNQGSSTRSRGPTHTASMRTETVSDASESGSGRRVDRPRQLDVGVSVRTEGAVPPLRTQGRDVKGSRRVPLSTMW
jgi:hypothetical protein